MTYHNDTADLIWKKTSFLPKKKLFAADGRIKLSAAKIAIALLSEQINLPSGNLLHNYT